jgi:hypothetical protein
MATIRTHAQLSPETAACRQCGSPDLERARFTWLFRSLYRLVGRHRYRCRQCQHVQWKRPLRARSWTINH